MARCLLITDCDEVLLYMASHFADWLGEVHDIDFQPFTARATYQMTRRLDGSKVPSDALFPMLGQFFESEMDRQTIVPHAQGALAAISAHAEIVVLTNLQDHHGAARAAQLARFGLHHRVVTNQGGKGALVRRLVADYQSDVTVFVDDLAMHHTSVADEIPEVWRLHMIAELGIAQHAPPAPDAHVRIDDWRMAQHWILDKFGITQHSLG